MRNIFLLFFLLYCINTTLAQYPPQAGILGSTAISKTSSQFSAWATGCHIQRGLQQINDASFGLASLGDSSAALGSPDGSVVSLGDSGIAVLTFKNPIINGAGFDFAIFENGFANINNPEEAFLELAFVEVSSDGIHFTRFPATSLTQDTAQLSSISAPSYTNARQLNNLAGKYISGYGTPFDLQELVDSPGLDVNHITYIRIVDAIGSVGNNASIDVFGHKVNDPFPTPFPGSGFDLDAVGVLHENTTAVLSYTSNEIFSIFPNPADNELFLIFLNGNEFLQVDLFDAIGRTLFSQKFYASTAKLNLHGIPAGTYFITITFKNGEKCTKAFLHR